MFVFMSNSFANYRFGCKRIVFYANFYKDQVNTHYVDVSIEQMSKIEIVLY
jgi:hypothetical protein